jgi:hypothetical protein
VLETDLDLKPVEIRSEAARAWCKRDGCHFAPGIIWLAPNDAERILERMVRDGLEIERCD